MSEAVIVALLNSYAKEEHENSNTAKLWKSPPPKREA